MSRLMKACLWLLASITPSFAQTEDVDRAFIAETQKVLELEAITHPSTLMRWTYHGSFVLPPFSIAVHPNADGSYRATLISYPCIMRNAQTFERIFKDEETVDDLSAEDQSCMDDPTQGEPLVLMQMPVSSKALSEIVPALAAICVPVAPVLPKVATKSDGTLVLAERADGSIWLVEAKECEVVKWTPGASPGEATDQELAMRALGLRLAAYFGLEHVLEFIG